MHRTALTVQAARGPAGAARCRDEQRLSPCWSAPWWQPLSWWATVTGRAVGISPVVPPTPFRGPVQRTGGSARGNQPVKAPTVTPAAASRSASLTPRSPTGQTSQRTPSATSQPESSATAVTADAAGPSPAGAVASLTSTLSWNQTVSGSSQALLVAVPFGEVPDSGMTASATHNGAVMTSLAMVQDDGQTAGFLEVFGMAGVPDGTNTIRVTVTEGPAQEITGGSVSFDGAASQDTFSAPAAATGYSAATGGRVTVTWSAISDLWGAIAVQVNS